MEIVVAADSDERGLTLLRLWNAFRRYVLQYCPLFHSSTPKPSHSLIDKSNGTDAKPTELPIDANETQSEIIQSEISEQIDTSIVKNLETSDINYPTISDDQAETESNTPLSADEEESEVSETNDTSVIDEQEAIESNNISPTEDKDSDIDIINTDVRQPVEIEVNFQSHESSEEDMPSISEEEISKQVRLYCESLVLSDETLREVSASLNKELDRGLGKSTNKEATVKCFPTFVQELPNGRESGRFLALDLGGTNFRVLLIELSDHKFSMDSKIYAVPNDIMIGPGTDLFDHIASCMASFIKERDMLDETLPLGFTFSFPCAQEGLTKARLARWTKGFQCSGVEGEDVVSLLKDAIAKRGDVSIKICAVLNDTTGTLMSCAWKNRNCMIGLIVGTGTNACYMEKLEKVELWQGSTDGPEQVVINTEWGAFGDNGCIDNIRCQCDINIDQESINPGKQLYEKMISGMYMGEIARQLLVQLVDGGLIFQDQPTDALREKGMFFTKYISEIESDEAGDFTNCQSVLEDLGIPEASPADCAHVRYVCEVVSRRAAFLAGAGVSVLLNRIGENKVTVAVDGSVYRFHPYFHKMMVEIISRLVKPGLKFDLMLSEDGSGRGAALVAAVASRASLEREQR